MKMLTQRFPSRAVLPVELPSLKRHIRVFDSSENHEIWNVGMTAAAELEQFAQIALLTQKIRVTIFDIDRSEGLDLPIGPVADADVPAVTVNGEAFADFDFVGGIRPYIRWRSSFFILAPSKIVVEYQAGFGEHAGFVPEDLAQALMDQAALHYDGRSPMDAKSLTTSPHMARVGARYRGVQV